MYGKQILPKGSLVRVGQRAHSILYGGRDGIVFRVNGEQAPASCGSIGGAIATGGRADFDIVFDDGSISRRVPESIVRGVQWRLFDEVATGEEIARALASAEQTEARRQTEAEATAARRQAERERHAKDNPHLVKKADKPQWSRGRVAAENIRRELKAAFPGVKFSVRSDYNAVDIGWQDGPTSKQVEAVVGKYKAGGFNGMEDIYEDDPDATFAQVFGDPDYVSCSRHDTLAGVIDAWQRAGNDPTEVPLDWEKGGRWKMEDSARGDLMFRKWAETDLREPVAEKPARAAAKPRARKAKVEAVEPAVEPAPAPAMTPAELVELRAELEAIRRAVDAADAALARLLVGR